MLQFEQFVNERTVHIEEMHFENYKEFNTAFLQYTTEFTNLQLAMEKADARCIEEYKKATTDHDRAAISVIYEGTLADFIKRAKEKAAKVIDSIINFIKGVIDKIKTKLGDWYNKFFNKYYELLKSNKVDHVKVPWIKVKEQKLNNISRNFDVLFKYVVDCFKAKSDEEFNDALEKLQDSIDVLSKTIDDIVRAVNESFKYKEDVEFGKIKARAIERASKKTYEGNLDEMNFLLKCLMDIKKRTSVGIIDNVKTMNNPARSQKIIVVASTLVNMYARYAHTVYKYTMSTYWTARKACTIAINELRSQKEQTNESVSLLDQMLTDM